MKSNYAVMVPYRLLRAFDIYTALIVSELIKWDEFYRRDHEDRWENLPEEFQQDPGWFYKSQNDWDVLGISRKKVSRAKVLLQELGILETIKKGPNIRVWYRFDQLALDNHLQNQRFDHIPLGRYGQMDKASTECTSKMYDDDALNDDRDDENDHTLNESNENSHFSKTDNSNCPKRTIPLGQNGQKNEIIDDYTMNDDVHSKNDHEYPVNIHADSIRPKRTIPLGQNGQMEMSEMEHSNCPNEPNALYISERTCRKDISEEDNSTILPIVHLPPSDHQNHQNHQESKKSKTEAEADDPFKKFWTKWSDKIKSYPERFDERSQTVRRPSPGIRSRASANYQALLKKKINGDLVTPVMIEKAARSYFASLPDDGFGVANCSTWLKLDNIEQYLEEESLRGQHSAEESLSQQQEDSLAVSFDTPREPVKILPRPEPIFDPFDWIKIDENGTQWNRLTFDQKMSVLRLKGIQSGDWPLDDPELTQREKELHPDYQRNLLPDGEHVEESLGRPSSNTEESFGSPSDDMMELTPEEYSEMERICTEPPPF